MRMAARKSQLEGFNKEQEKRLRTRKKMPSHTEVDRWVEIYKILFPDADETNIPSPCKWINDILNSNTINKESSLRTRKLL